MLLSADEDESMSSVHTRKPHSEDKRRKLPKAPYYETSRLSGNIQHLLFCFLANLSVCPFCFVAISIRCKMFRISRIIINLSFNLCKIVTGGRHNEMSGQKNVTPADTPRSTKSLNGKA